MPEQRGLLEPVVGRLERALAEDGAGRGPAWAAEMDGALASLQQAVRYHADDLESPDGRLVEIDGPLFPSPTLTRRTDGLRRELASFLTEAHVLQNQVRAARHAPDTSPDLGRFCRRTRRLLRSLDRYQAEETELVLASITQDIGAGD